MARACRSGPRRAARAPRFNNKPTPKQPIRRTKKAARKPGRAARFGALRPP